MRSRERERERERERDSERKREREREREIRSGLVCSSRWTAVIDAMLQARSYNIDNIRS